MPVGTSIRPRDLRELNDKVLKTIPGKEEYLILEYVQSHLGIRGHAVYDQARENIKDVNLSATKCIIFLLGGQFKVGEELVTERGIGYTVENENMIQLQRYTIVVIIDQV
ncbi:hypothetical protein ACEPPN_018981 [Leptodophora sp. 'Broadleaf-Isolate-01']